ncbi:MAG: hypothetical protein ABJG15_07520 [Hyphomonadaceae bacterium]
MADATIKLLNGTTVTISGSPEEIVRVVSLYGDTQSNAPQATGAKNASQDTSSKNEAPQDQVIDLTTLINTAKDCEEAELIESKVLDSDDVVNRVLMCLYINEKYFQSSPAMTTGDISKMLTQLAVPVTTGNVSNAISRKAKSFVMSDGVRKKGAVIRYSLNRRGLNYFGGILSGETQSISPPSPRKKARTSKPSLKKEPAGTLKQSPKVKKSKAKAGGYKPKYNAQLDLHGLKEFVGSLSLKNNTECVIAFYKFLTKRDAERVLNGDDIYTCFDELKSSLKIPGSFMNTLRNAQNKEHVIGYESNFTNITLTPKGENLFNHDIIKRERDKA